MELLCGLCSWLVMIAVEIMFGYQAIVGQGPAGLIALAVVGMNTFVILSTIFDIADAWDKMNEEES